MADLPSVFLVDVHLNVRRGGWLLIVRCESDSGISIDELAAINRSINTDLELPGLDLDTLAVEVTSPGTGYAVTEPRHFRRYTGHSMRIKHQLDLKNNPIEGLINSVSDDLLELDVDGETVQIPFDAVVEGKVKLQW